MSARSTSGQFVGNVGLLVTAVALSMIYLPLGILFVGIVCIKYGLTKCGEVDPDDSDSGTSDETVRRS